MYSEKYDVAGFLLEQQVEDVNTVFVPVGGVVLLVNQHHNEDHEEGEILVDRRLNGVPLDEVLEQDRSHCLFAVPFFDLFFAKRLAFQKRGDNPEHFQHLYPSEFTTLIDLYSFCVGYDSFGEHTSSVRRFFYNPETKTEDFVEAELPLVTRLGPSYPGPFERAADNEDASFFDQCWNNNTDYCSASKRWNKIYFSWHLLVSELFTMSFVFLFPCILLYYYYWVLKRTFIFLFAGSLRPPNIETLSGVSLRPSSPGSQNAPEADSEYDVFLAYDLADQLSVEPVREILCRLQQRVFDCHRDVVPGAPSLSAWDRAIGASLSFVVVASPTYTSDPELMLQFRAMHFCMLSQEVSEDRMLILEAQPCVIPRSLGPLPIIDLRHAANRRQIELWIRLKGRPSDQSTLRRLCQDIQSEVRHLFNRDSSASCPRLAPQRLPRVSEHGHGTDCPLLGGPAHQIPPRARTRRGVFLTYCQESGHDAAIAAAIKTRLQDRSGLRVFDAAQDVLGGQEEVQVVTEAAGCDSFVVVMSPAYRRHPLTRRLHFPLVLQALLGDRVSPDSVLLVNRAGGRGGFLRQQPGQQRPPDDPNLGADDDDDDDDDDDEGWRSPEWFRAFVNVQWTGNLSEEDHLRQVTRWARAQRRPLVRNRRADLGALRALYLEGRSRDLHRPLTLTYFGRLIV